MIFLKAKWQNIIMVNYEVPVEFLSAYVPQGVELDLYNGKAYISLVGFLFKNTKLFNIPIPGLGTFEEINLRFYVVKKNNGENLRGVVFINETVPYKSVAWMANKLYKEHYSTFKTKSSLVNFPFEQHIRYEWLLNNQWQHISVAASSIHNNMLPDSLEEFIYDHYAGYTKVNSTYTLEYRIKHPSWKVYPVKAFDIKCDFDAMYGKAFEFMNHLQPKSVYLAEGSAVSIDWKRNRIA
ncbi:MAG: DUF2071 domain-containing protein [Cytophagaceae bacterium]|nr:DUF2071 domain-containing protein [Cytophagaceae bacterium]